MLDITLENIGHGALVEKFEKALTEVVLNTTDPNTDSTTKRELTIKLTFAPDKHDRAKMKMTTDVKTKLGQPRPLESVVMSATIRIPAKSQRLSTPRCSRFCLIIRSHQLSSADSRQGQ